MQINSNISTYSGYKAFNNASFQRRRNKNEYVSFGNAQSSATNVFSKANDKLTSGLAHFFGRIAGTKPAQKLVDFLKDKNYQEHLAAFVGCVLSGFYMRDTYKSKTIEKDQKFPLMVNQGIVCGISTVGAYTLNHYLNKKINHVAEYFHISQIEDKTLQDEFLKCKADYSYNKELAKNSEANPELKTVFSDLDKKFEFTSKEKVYLKEELKKHKEDNVAKEFLKEIKHVKKTADQEKADVIKDLFMQKMKNSKAMQGAYDRASMNNAITKLANSKFAGKLPNMINGFVSPVVATPIANKISEKIDANKKAKSNQVK